MSIEAPHTTGLFAELLEGANALAQRPTLIAERDQAHLEMRAAQDRADRFNAEINRQTEVIASLTAALKEKEAALAQATFQHSELGSKLSLVASVLKDVMGNATAAMELVEPPKPEPIADPTPEPVSSVETALVEASVSTTVPSETDLPGTFPYGSRETYIHHEPMASPEDQSASGPTASSDSERYPPVVSTSGTVKESTTTPADPSTSASSPKPYWEKPQSEEWLSWAKAGNDVAPWVTFNWYEKQELDVLKRA